LSKIDVKHIKLLAANPAFINNIEKVRKPSYLNAGRRFPHSVLPVFVQFASATHLTSPVGSQSPLDSSTSHRDASINLLSLKKLTNPSNPLIFALLNPNPVRATTAMPLFHAVFYALLNAIFYASIGQRTAENACVAK
jgi:hypothetical protein